MDPIKQFKIEVERNISSIGADKDMKDLSRIWLRDTLKHKYTYNFSWMGRPIIQYPQDMIAIQELIWKIQPDLIIETGIAHGGSLILSASMLAMLDLCESIENRVSMNPLVSSRKVLGIDIDIRAHNLEEIKAHPMSSRIEMIEGSSIEEQVISKVTEISRGYKKILVCLDSNHTHEHVLSELYAYAPLVSKDSYCVVFDTVIEDLPSGTFPDRPWDLGNNPKTAVKEFLESNNDFVIDSDLESKLLITVAPDGYLKKIA